MKFKLTSGNSSFSFEGELQEAKVLLDAYWNPQQTILEQPLAAKKDEAPSQTPKKRRRKHTPSNSPKVTAVTIDATELANTIKSSELFHAIKQKILDKDKEWPNKCKLVAHFAKEPITSGDVKRTMDALRIKSALSTLSKALSSNSDQFLTAGENPVKYELTSTAESEFEKWLKTEANE